LDKTIFGFQQSLCSLCTLEALSDNALYKLTLTLTLAISPHVVSLWADPCRQHVHVQPLFSACDALCRSSLWLLLSVYHRMLLT